MPFTLFQLGKIRSKYDSRHTRIGKQSNGLCGEKGLIDHMLSIPILYIFILQVIKVHGLSESIH